MGTFQNIAITLVVFSAVTALFANYMGGMASTYNTTAYNNETLSTYNKLNQLNVYTQNMEANTLAAKRSDASFADLLTGYFTSAWQSVLLATSVFSVFDDLLNSLLVDLNLGAVGTILKVAMGSIMVLVMVFGLIKLLTGGRDV